MHATRSRPRPTRHGAEPQTLRRSDPDSSNCYWGIGEEGGSSGAPKPVRPLGISGLWRPHARGPGGGTLGLAPEAPLVKLVSRSFGQMTRGSGGGDWDLL